MGKLRGFEVIDEDLLPRYDNGHQKKPCMPCHATVESAGYDIKALGEGVIMPGQSVKIHTGIKAYMQHGEVLKLYGRSSLGIKHGIVLSNGTAIIDADYYGNPTNDGEIIIGLRNEGHEPFRVNYGDRIAQGIFQTYLSADKNTVQEVGADRIGGIGSTGI